MKKSSIALVLALTLASVKAELADLIAKLEIFAVRIRHESCTVKAYSATVKNALVTAYVYYIRHKNVVRAEM